MSLTGTYHRTLDEKNRLTIPKRVRDDLMGNEENLVYVTPETNRSLGLYSCREFHKRGEKLANMAGHAATVRNYQRLYYSQADQVELDSQGRILLPERLLQFAGIRQEVALLGVHDHVELWDRTNWEAFLAEHAAGFDQLTHAALSMD